MEKEEIIVRGVNLGERCFNFDYFERLSKVRPVLAVSADSAFFCGP